MNTQPNLILFTWHDAGDWFGCYGHDTVDTPGVDRLAAEGVRFSNNISACAICSPSRAAITTGRFCQENGVMTLANTAVMNRIHPGIPHIAKRVKERGYTTALFGVQHETAHEHVHEIMGFDSMHDTDPWPKADVSAANVRAWLAEQKKADRPFYAQIGSFEAHLGRYYTGEPTRDDEPYPPTSDTSKGLHLPGYVEHNEDARETVATLQGLLKRGDTLMQATLDALDELGLSENTLVVMCVDHGVGLKRAKATCYEAGTRTAWIMRKPGQIPAGTVVDTMTTHVDVLPTVWELMGLDAIDGLDGVSLASQATGGEQAEVHDAVFSHMVEITRSIRTPEYRLIRNFRPPGLCGQRGDCGVSRKMRKAKPPVKEPHVELYDHRIDPDCMNDLSEDAAHADVRDDLDARLWKFLVEHDDFVIHEPVRSEWQAQTQAALRDRKR